MSSARPKPPAGLMAAGKALWRSILDDLPEAVEFDAREVALLAQAARQADDIAGLEEAIRRDGITVKGSTGQPRLNAALSELRQSRLALGRLLGALEFPTEDGKPESASSQRARRAAHTRWVEHNARRATNG